MLRHRRSPVLVYDLDLLTTVWWLSGKELVDSWAGPQLACVAAHVTVWGGTFITFYKENSTALQSVSKHRVSTCTAMWGKTLQAFL